MSDTRKTAAVAFLGAFVLVVALVGVASLAVSDESAPSTTAAPEQVELANPQYSADYRSVNSDPGEADIQMESSAFNKKVVIHAGGSISERDITPLVSALIEEGHEVDVLIDQQQTVGPGPIVLEKSTVSQIGAPPSGGQDEPRLNGRLEDAHAFVSIGVDSYVDEDIEEIQSLVEDNGRVLMAVNPGQKHSFGTGQSDTYSTLGVYTDPGYVYNLEENDLNYQRIFAEPDGSSALTEGVERAVFDSATPVGAESVDESMRPIEGSELSVTRDTTEKPVLVRNGNTVLVGDTLFMTPENTQRADNDVLVGNIADFLVNSDRSFGTSNGGQENGDSAETHTVEVGPDGEPVFDPEILEIDPGDTVEFVWESDGHNIVPVFQQPEDAEWDGVPEPKEEGFIHEFTFEEEGVHEFISEPFEEEGMVGTIVVGDPEPPSDSDSGSGSDSGSDSDS